MEGEVVRLGAQHDHVLGRQAVPPVIQPQGLAELAVVKTQVKGIIQAHEASV
jgi:hypothetical protein